MFFLLDDWSELIYAGIVGTSGCRNWKISQSGRACSRHRRNQLGKDQQVGTGFKIIQALNRQQIGSYVQKADERRDVEIGRNNRDRVVPIGRSAIRPGGDGGIRSIAPGHFSSVDIGDESVIKTHSQRQAADDRRIVHNEGYADINRLVDILHPYYIEPEITLVAGCSLIADAGCSTLTARIIEGIQCPWSQWILAWGRFE